MLSQPDRELALTAEMLSWRQDRLDGKAFRILAVAMGLEQTELAAALGTTPQEIYRIEDLKDSLVPEKLDIGIRKLFWNR